MKSNRYPTPEERYGLSPAEKEEILGRPRCEICERTWAEVEEAYRKRRHRPPKKRLSNIDHCHTCDKVRGLLCTRCNYWVVGVLEQGQTRPRANPRLQAAAASYIRKGCQCHWRRRLLEWAKKRLVLGWTGWQALGAALMLGFGAGLVAATGYRTGLLTAPAVWAAGRIALMFTGAWKHRARGEDIAYGGFRAMAWCIILAVAATALLAAAIITAIGAAIMGLAEMSEDNQRHRRSRRRSSSASGYQRRRSSRGSRNRRRPPPRRRY